MKEVRGQALTPACMSQACARVITHTPTGSPSCLPTACDGGDQAGPPHALDTASQAAPLPSRTPREPSTPTPAWSELGGVELLAPLLHREAWPGPETTHSSGLPSPLPPARVSAGSPE